MSATVAPTSLNPNNRTVQEEVLRCWCFRVCLGSDWLGLFGELVDRSFGEGGLDLVWSG